MERCEKKSDCLKSNPRGNSQKAHAWASRLTSLLAMCATVFVLGFISSAQATNGEYVLRSGDVIRISVFQSPELTTEARISETGKITFPLLGALQIGGETLSAAEQLLAKKLSDGGFLVNPQVNIFALEMYGNQFAVLGQVNKPGRYPLETTNTRLSDVLAAAGGISPTGADVVLVTGTRDGQPLEQEIDTNSMLTGGRANDIVLEGGDTVFVRRAPIFYIYGEVQKPGAIRLERSMTVVQALASGGGLTPRGTVRGLTIQRHDDKGNLKELKPKMNDTVLADDVIYVKESLF